jgi:hypothetical protein
MMINKRKPKRTRREACSNVAPFSMNPETEPGV